jgi:O-antigen ligase
MGAELATSLRSRRRAATSPPPATTAKPARKLSNSAWLALGLWFVLWGGYNTDITRLLRPGFPTDTLDLIHGLRAILPALAGWVACLVIFVRSKRLFGWIVGPLGLMLLYAIIGLLSSVALSMEPVTAVYYGINYLAIILVILAISLVEDPLPDLLRVLKFTWGVGLMLTLGLLGVIPFLGSQAIVPTEGSPVGIRAYTGSGSLLGMSATRNTGFARYAAISALALFPTLLRKGTRLTVRIAFGILLCASLYALYIANGRTEIAAFAVSMMLIVLLQRARRVIYILMGTAGAILVGMYGFYSGFFRYFTRASGRIDPTFTGRTEIWANGWRYIMSSPFVGLGFQADRIYIGWHMHNAFLHVLIQSGFIGGVAMYLALAIVWYHLIYHFLVHPPADESLVPAEIAAIFLFTTTSSMTESTFAYYSANWLLAAPIVAYVMALHVRMRKASFQASLEREQRTRLAKRQARMARERIEIPHPPSGEVTS